MRVLRWLARVFLFGVVLCCFLWPTLVAFFWMSERLDQIHTTSTARDPIPGLTAAQVLRNVLQYSVPCALGVVLVALIIYWCIYGILEDDDAKTRRRWSLGTALLYWVFSFGVLVLIAIDCYRDYVMAPG